MMFCSWSRLGNGGGWRHKSGLKGVCVACKQVRDLVRDMHGMPSGTAYAIKRLIPAAGRAMSWNHCSSSRWTLAVHSQWPGPVSSDFEGLVFSLLLFWRDRKICEVGVWLSPEFFVVNCSVTFSGRRA